MKSDYIFEVLENLFFILGLNIIPLLGIPIFTGPVEVKLLSGIDVVKPPGVTKLLFFRFF